MAFSVIFMDERVKRVKVKSFISEEEATTAALSLTSLYPDSSFEEIDKEEGGALLVIIDHTSASSICVVEEGDLA